MFFLLPLVGAAVGAVAGALAAHAAGKGDRQQAKYHREVANRLHDDYSNLKIKYNQESNQNQKQNNKSLQLQALSEAEKDLLRLTLRLQQSLYKLMFDIDREPSTESLQAFATAVSETNNILCKLKEETIKIPEGYFERNFQRITESKVKLALDKTISNAASHSNLRDRDRGEVLVISRSRRRSSDFMEWSD